MKHNTIFDVSSNGLSKHMTTATVAKADVLHAVSSDPGAGFSIAQFTENPLPLVTLIFATLAIFMFKPAIQCAREFYRGCFKPKCWYGPWRRWIFDLVWYFADIFAVVAVVYFLYVYAGTTINPLIAGSQLNLYLAVFVLVLLFVFVFRWFWINSFWNYHNTSAKGGARPVFSAEARIALGFALLFAILMLLSVLALGIIFGIARAWVSFFFIIPLFIWTIVLLVWTAMVFACTSCATVCEPACVPVCETVCPQQPLCPTPYVYQSQAQKRV